MLEELYLNHNQITVIHDESFVGLTNLKTLEFSDNLLGNLSKNAFEPLVNLRKLIMNNGNVRSIHEDTFKKNMHLKEIHLKNQSIYGISRDFLKNVENLEILDLRENFCVKRKFEFSTSFSYREVEANLGRKLLEFNYEDDEDEKEVELTRDHATMTIMTTTLGSFSVPSIRSFQEQMSVCFKGYGFVKIADRKLVEIVPTSDNHVEKSSSNIVLVISSLVILIMITAAILGCLKLKKESATVVNEEYNASNTGQAIYSKIDMED
jgi:hypothetical protein